MTRPLPFTPGTLDDAFPSTPGIAADSLRDDSKPLSPIISSLTFALVVIGCAAVVCGVIAWEIFHG